MHPGPMNRGVEMVVDPAELTGSVILDQVTNGVGRLVAVLFRLLGSGSDLKGDASMSRDRDSRRHRAGPVRRTPRQCSRSAQATSPSRNVSLERRRLSRRHRPIVSPGLIDMHVHLREPGREEDETIATGTAPRRRGHPSWHAEHRAGPTPWRSIEFIVQPRPVVPGSATSYKAGAVPSRRAVEGKELTPNSAGSRQAAFTCSPTTARVCRIRC